MQTRRPRLAVLTISPQAISKLDPNDPSVLGSLWSTFTRCADSIENGHRLENMSWRLWNREIFQGRGSRLGGGQLTFDRLSNDTHVKTDENMEKSVGNRPLESNSKSIPNGHYDMTSNSGGIAPTSANMASTSGNMHSNSANKPSKSDISTQKDKNQHNNKHASVSINGNLETANSSNNKSESEIILNTTSKSVPVRKLSSQQIQKIFELFKPEKEEEDHWKSLWEAKRNKKVKSGISRPSDSSLKRISSTNNNVKTPISNASTNKQQNRSSNGPAITSTNSEIKVRSLFAKKSSSSIPNQAENGEISTEKDTQNRNNAPRRNNTFTSIVRGFSPKNISVSAVHRLSHDADTISDNRDKTNISDEENGQYSKQQRFKVRKAPADKATRENMFFIESSPSDNDHGDGNSLSSNNTGSPMIPLRAPSKSNNKPHEPEKALPPKTTSLFAKSRSTSAISTTMRERYQAKKNESAFTEDTSEEEDEWDSVDDSDYSFDEKSLIARDDDNLKKPLVRSSLLSSLFLNNPELVQRQQEEQKKLQKSKKSSQKKTEGISKKSAASEHSEDHHGTLPTDMLRENHTSHSSSSVAMSPRTIRRNMLATELSKSVKETLLWERNAADALAFRKPDGLRRSHTATGVPLMVQNGQRGTEIDSSSQIDSDNMDFDFNYHARGW